MTEHESVVLGFDGKYVSWDSQAVNCVWENGFSLAKALLQPMALHIRGGVTIEAYTCRRHFIQHFIMNTIQLSQFFSFLALTVDLITVPAPIKAALE